jgi:hypothetical protein
MIIAKVAKKARQPSRIYHRQTMFGNIFFISENPAGLVDAQKE